MSRFGSFVHTQRPAARDLCEAWSHHPGTGFMTDRETPLILIADDDPEIRKLLKAHLSTMECDIIEASDGALTLESLIVNKPDLIILDVMMPELNGWEICKYVKEREEYENTGVLMLTAIGAKVNELTSPLYGADAYVDKPFNFDELEAKINAILAEKRG
ncbi:MAG: two-component system response regulator [Myxococcales bacterium]|nr:two-component system response regulator [Myxococcales bacterium]